MKACVPACVWRREEANTHTGSQACPEHEPSTYIQVLTNTRLHKCTHLPSTLVEACVGPMCT